MRDRRRERLARAGELARTSWADQAARRRLRRAVRRELRAAGARARSHLPGSRRGVVSALPDNQLPEGPVARPGLRVATILDPFSALAWRYEWDQRPVPREGWREELELHPPDLLFVESAWAGNERAWRLTMTREEGPHPDLVALVAWCRDRGIPTVFWNKEDPPNYAVFIATAALFDQVFTVDADMVDRYVEDLGHDAVGLLPFAAQPRIHSPVRHLAPDAPELAGRSVAFAGTFFTGKHSERRRQMDFLLPAAQERGLHIFSRLQAEDERYQFPPRYASSVVGSLPYPQMLAAVRAYPVFLNVNSVTSSPTMCARRLFELSAAQTAVLSAPAVAIEPFFGDTVTVAHDQQEATTALGVLLDQKEHRDRIALRAHRRVHDAHLYTHRVDAVLASVGLSSSAPTPSISAVVPTMRPESIGHVLTQVGVQVLEDLELVLGTQGFEVDTEDLRRQAREAGVEHLTVRGAPPEWTLGACMNLGVDSAGGRYVAKMDDDNVYAPHYLSDLVRAFSYSQAQVVGKWAHYVHLAATNALVLRFPHAEHRYTDLVQGGTLLTPREVASSLRFEDLPRAVDTTFLQKVRASGGRVYSADRFNFLSRRSASTAGHTWTIADRDLLNRSSRIVGYGDGIDHVTV